MKYFIFQRCSCLLRWPQRCAVHFPPNKPPSYLPLCLSLNSFCNETSRAWASWRPETRCVISGKRPWLHVSFNDGFLRVHAQGAQLCHNLGGWEMGGYLRREGTYVYMWLIHADVRQKPTQYSKAIILQLKKDHGFCRVQGPNWVTQFQVLHGAKSVT